MPDNISVYVPGQDITVHASADVLGKRFLKVSGNRTDSNIAVSHADAAGRVFGVAKYDAPTGRKTSAIRSGAVTYVIAQGAIAAFAEVEVGADGKAKALASGVAVGYAVTAAADGGDAEISLY